MPDSSAEIVLQALSAEGLEKVAAHTHTLIESRQRFIARIEGLDWIETIYPSATNFVLIRTKPDMNLFEYLREQGIVTRNQTHEPSLQNCVRITIGSEKSMQEVAETICNYTNLVTPSIEI